MQRTQALKWQTQIASTQMRLSTKDYTQHHPLQPLAWDNEQVHKWRGRRGLHTMQ